jgi:hypothetical protein
VQFNQFNQFKSVLLADLQATPSAPTARHTSLGLCEWHPSILQEEHAHLRLHVWDACFLQKQHSQAVHLDSLGVHAELLPPVGNVPTMCCLTQQQ